MPVILSRVKKIVIFFPGIPYLYCPDMAGVVVAEVELNFSVVLPDSAQKINIHLFITSFDHINFRICLNFSGCRIFESDAQWSHASVCIRD